MRLRALELWLLFAWVALPSAAFADDAAIAEQLSKTLKAAQTAGELEGFRLSVNVEEGTVWLKGQVANEEQRKLALDRARRVSGVKLVVNDIKLQGATGQIASDASNTRHPSVDSSAAVAKAASVVPIPAVSPARARRSAQVQPSYPVPVSARPMARPIQYMEGGMESGAPAGCPPGGYSDGYSGGYSGGYAGETGSYPSQGYSMGAPAQESGGGYGGSYSGGVNYEQPQMPGYAWPSYAANQNYAAVSYPQQYSPQAWPYIGPFYPYPQVPLGWRKVTLEWDDGWWMLDFKSK